MKTTYYDYCFLFRSTKRQRSSSPEPKVNSKKLKTARLPKPPYTYIGMIVLAAESQPEKSISTYDLFEFLKELFPFFRTSYTGWTNTIRKILKEHKAFTCVTQLKLGNSVWKVDLSELPSHTFDRKQGIVDSENWAPTLFQQVNMPEIVIPSSSASTNTSNATLAWLSNAQTTEMSNLPNFNPDLSISVDDMLNSFTNPLPEMADDARRADIFDNSSFQFFALPRPTVNSTLRKRRNITKTKEYKQLQHIMDNHASSLLVSPEVAVNNLRLLCDSVTSIFGEDKESSSTANHTALHNQIGDSTFIADNLLDNLEKDVDIAELVNISLLG